MQKQFITISTSSFLKALLILVILGLVYLIWDILLLFFVALLLAALIMPLADWASTKKIPRGLTVFLVYLIALGLVVGVVALLVPPIVSQVSQLSGNFELYRDKALSFLYWAKDLAVHYKVWDSISKIIPSTLADGVGTAQKVVGTVFGFLDGIGSLVLILVMAFYVVAEEESFKRLIRYFTPTEYQPYFGSLWRRIKEKLGYWLRGQLLLDFVVGAVSYVGLLIIGVPYALLLGLLAGIFETIPYAGPVFSAVIAVVLTILQTGNWVLTFFVLILFIAIQQLENNFLVPQIMKRAIGLDPIISILSLLIGYRLLGIIGAILAIPLMAVFSVVWSEVLVWRSKQVKK